MSDLEVETLNGQNELTALFYATEEKEEILQLLSLLSLLNEKRRHGDGSSVPERSEGRRENDGTVPCGLAG